MDKNRDIIQNILCSHAFMGHKGEYMMSECSFIGELSLVFFLVFLTLRNALFSPGSLIDVLLFNSSDLLKNIMSF